MTGFQSRRNPRKLAVVAAVGVALLIGCAGTAARAADDGVHPSEQTSDVT